MHDSRGSKPVFQCDFESDPESGGWIYEGESSGDPLVDGGCRSSKSLIVKDGKWESPLIPVEPFGYYKIKFCTKSKELTWWAAQFFSADGQPVAADHYWGIDPSDDWAETVFCTEARIDATHFRSRFQTTNSPLQVGCVSVEHVTRTEVVDWADQLYSTIPPVNYTPPADRWKHIPKTIEKLQSGRTLRVVMLGDSICNDTANGPFNVWIERNYPGARLEIIHSVEGGKGCWFYREDNRVERYVVDFNPDLFVVAGISHGNDLEAIRDVVGQVRKKIDPEIMFVTPVVSNGNDPTTGDEWTSKVDPDGESFRSGLYRLADELGCEFFDMTGPWGSYIVDCGKPIEWFRRDVTHANDRGAIVLSKIVERFFSP